ncbi:hypothetical protein HX837_04575 [Marine Group I thaumarchaeote]|uniref:Uncharacterized protein n=1 Tax=Marine Group I thaumarchaeote TaxID=2511932 RepID=A0A7K4MPH0_9ARCH|nr:hypothetical protein [Marine Group I thaumarchaeote]
MLQSFKFSNNEETFDSIESRGFKRAVKEFQRSYKGQSVRIQYTNKAGNDIDRWIKIPIGRKKRGIGVPEPFMTPKMKKKEEEKQAKKGYR